MDTSIKQMFLSITFVFLTTISGLIFNYNQMHESHKVRLDHIEENARNSDTSLKILSADIATVKTENATIVVMLTQLDKTVTQLDRTTMELSRIAARLDERSKTK